MGNHGAANALLGTIFMFGRLRTKFTYAPTSLFFLFFSLEKKNHANTLVSHVLC